jgi:DNA-binding SARP family transcriptional activator/tetratricopeptide (TPR) repeat protein
VSVARGADFLALPPSKKTRALLAYLVVTERTHRRDRLCSLLWDVTDDPRGALRWSLSRLRPLVNDAEVQRILADREGVAFRPEGAEVDVHFVRNAVRGGISDQPTDALMRLAGVFRGEFLAGLELTDFHDFQAWCVKEREEMRRHHACILRALVDRLAEDPEAALPHARALVEVDPLDEEARIQLVHLLARADRLTEAEQHVRAGSQLFRDLGSRRGERLVEAWSELRRVAPVMRTAEAPASATKAPPSASTPTSEAPGPSSASTQTLVGRQALLARLTSLLDMEEDRGPRLVALRGEPGVGKTRLLSEALAEARRRGSTVLRGRAYEAEVGRPLGPWIDALRSLASTGQDPAPGGELALLLPELARSPTPEINREQLFEAVARFLGARARPAAPVIVALDDVHWLDEASTALLHYVVRTAVGQPLRMFLTARDGELPDNPVMLRTLRSIRQDGLSEEVAVGPLDRDETAALARSVRDDVDPERVYRESGGNPLLAIEVARSLALRSESVAASLRDLVRSRLEHVPPVAADVLRWGAVLGPTFAVRRLQGLSTANLDELIGALETLERHGLLVATRSHGGSSDGYAFTHDVVRRAVYADISEPRRRLMHARAAEALQGQEATDEVVSELARHASMADEPGMAAAACVRAARRCLRLFAFEEAQALVRRGMRHAEELPEPERVERQLELHEVSLAARRPDPVDEAVRALETLAERALDLGKVDHARLGFHLVSHLRWERGQWTEAHRQSMRAAVVGRTGDEQGRVLAVAQAAQCLALLERDLGQAEALALEAQALAERCGTEPAAIADAMGMVHLHRGDLVAAREAFARSRDLARSEGDHRAELTALEHLARVDLQRLAYVDAEAWCAALLDLCRRLEDPASTCLARALAALCRLAMGKPGAEEALDEAVVSLRQADAKLRLAYVQNRRAQLELMRGETARAVTHATEALEAASRVEQVSELALARALLGRASDAARDCTTADAQAEALVALTPELLSLEARQGAEQWLASRVAKP